MKFKLAQSVLRCLWFVGMFVVCTYASTQTQAPPSSRGKAQSNPSNLVAASPMPVADTVGGELTLPDGSVIKTVWPAALEVITITDNPKWANQPTRPRCEPAVYSLARVMPDGKELWAKSYIFKGKVIDICYAEYFGFNVRSALREAVKPEYYLRPFDGKFFINEPTDSKKIEVDAETGNVVGAIPKYLHVIDAYELRTLKDQINQIILDALPSPSTKKGQMNEQVHKTQFYKHVEQTLFPSR